MQDRCMVYAKHTVGSEIIFDAPDSVTKLKWMPDLVHLI
jgi:hypothetical protein